MSEAAWWPDPLGRHEMRYHDGTSWTEHVSDRGLVATDPLRAAPPPQVAPLPAPEPASSIPAPGTTDAFAGTRSFAPPTGAPTDRTPRPVPFGSVAEAPTPLISPAGTPKRLKWLLLVVFLVVIAVAVALIVSLRGGGDEPDADRPGTATSAASGTLVPVTDPAATVPAVTVPAVTDPAVTDPAVTGAPATTPGGIPDGSAGAVPVGTTVRADGSLVRLDRIVPNVPGDGVFGPAAGNSLTAIDVEACAGENGFASNSFYWSAFLADDTVADNFFFADDLPTLQLAPGGCIRGIVSFEAPEAQPIASVVLTDFSFAEIARWTAADGVEVTEPLEPEINPGGLALGTTATYGAGHTATVRSVEDAAAPIDDLFPPDPGRQYNIIDVELCAGDESLTVNGLYWLAVGTDNRAGTAALAGDTLPFIDLAAGQCAAGRVQLDVPAGTTTAAIIHVDPAFDEVARWSIG